MKNPLNWTEAQGEIQSPSSIPLPLALYPSFPSYPKLLNMYCICVQSVYSIMLISDQLYYAHLLYYTVEDE
jgi:hypothetical protein